MQLSPNVHTACLQIETKLNAIDAFIEKVGDQPIELNLDNAALLAEGEAHLAFFQVMREFARRWNLHQSEFGHRIDGMMYDLMHIIGRDFD